MSRRGRAMPSVLPVPTHLQGSPARSSTQGLSGQATLAHSAEDIPKQLNSSHEKDKKMPLRRRVPSPGETRRGSLVAQVKSGVQAGATHQPGVRYITEDLIKKIAKEDNLDLITSLSLTLVGEKKIKYIENLDKLRTLQSLNLSSNAIECLEHLDKLVLLRELNLANNMLTKIEGLESLTSLQTLNVSDNRIEHIPPWVAKKLKTLRTFRIARNKLVSLSEVSKLKALPDLTQIDIAGNPLCEIPHCTPYVVFHLRTVQVLDGRTIHDKERKEAKDRFAIDEIRQLERQLEQEEMKYKQLEESYNKTMQERSAQESSNTEMKSKKNSLQNKLKQMEQELATKDEKLKKKTVLLNTASQKHYQLEQELAFYKIDKKFNMLSEVPHLQVDSADDSSDIQEVPYIGRARFVANQHAQESTISGATPQVIQTHSVKSSATSLQLAAPTPSPEKMHAVLDSDLERKQAEVQKTEEKLKFLQADLSATERRLLNAATELKKLATDRITPEPFRDDNRYKLRQRLARKMQRVNELRESETQMQTEIDRKQEHISAARGEIQKIKNQLTQMDASSVNYETKQKELVNKESQLAEFNQDHSQLKKEHEEALANIGKEITDINKLEEQLTTNNADQSVELHHDLDDIVTGLSDYLETVKGQSVQNRQDFEILVQEKEGLEEKIRQMEVELQILEGEASSARQMQKKLTELEDSLRKTEELNISLRDEAQSQQKDPDLQNRLLKAENEAKLLRQTLTETEKKTEMEWKAMQKQLQTERERAEKMAHRIQDVNRQDLETKKLMSQLEAAKALNVGLRDQIEEFKHKQQMVEGGFKPSDLKKRLKKFAHDFKSNKNLIEPQDRNDILGVTFHELQKHAQQQLNTSAKEVVELKKAKEKADAEIQTLKEKLKKTDITSKTDTADDIRLLQDENKQLQENVKRLKKMLEEARERNKEGAIPVRIVYRPDSDSGDRASSLNSDEKHLFDELQKELLDLKQSMRYHENDLSRKVTDAESEAAHWKDKIRQKEKEFEAELEMHRLATELMREKQEARIQVIAQDLDQAQFIAESLQHMLEDRERTLREGLNNADMSNQMITAQEEELTKLYEILEAQRNEIEHLNRILDHLAQQGPDGVGAAFDDELWRIRQEVNNLKETLAMQSAYVQAMPAVGHMGSQADGAPYGTFAPQGYPSQRVTDLSVRNSGAAAAAETHLGGNRLFASLPASFIREPGFQKVSAQILTGGHSGSLPSVQPAMNGPTTPVIPNYGPSQTFGIAGDTREQPVEHLGTERRESKAPSPGKSAVGKSGSGRVNQREDRTQERVQDRSFQQGSRGMTPFARLPSASEPAVEPEAYHLHQASPPQADTVHVPTTAVYVGASPGSRTPVSASLPLESNLPPHIRPNLPPHIGPNLPPHIGPNLPPHIGPNLPPHIGPNLPPHIGPNLPPHIGPNLPPHIGPNLPPHIGPNLPPHIGPNLPPHIGPNLPPHIGPNLPPHIGPNLPPHIGPNLPPHIGPNLPPHIGPNLPPHIGPNLPPHIGPNLPPHIGPNLPPHIGQNLPHTGPSHSSQTTGVQGLSRGVQAGTLQQGLPPSVGYPGVSTGYIRPTPTGPSSQGPPFASQQPISSVPLNASHVYGASVAPVPTMIPGAQAMPMNSPLEEADYNRGVQYQGFDGSSVGRGYTIGRQTYLPSGPAQVSHYGPERFYVPAVAGYSGRQGARIYYPLHRSIPMPAPGGAPPPPPPGNHAQVIAHAPLSANMVPVATATPVRGRMLTRPADNGSFFVAPPSPIRAVGIDADVRRGILKNMDGEHVEADDSYLYCNVPEHHDLEDYTAELQEHIKKLKLRLSREKNFQEESLLVEERKNTKKLLNDLEDRRTELQGLDLAIERQKRNLRDMKLEEKELRRDRNEALDELGYWRRKNNKKIFTRRHYSKDDSFDEEAERSRQKYVKDELACLEKTLAKRQAQLRDTERSLKECKSNLLDAKEQARDTVKRYDDATGNLNQALREQQEIEKRSNDICVELVTASESLKTLKAEVRDIERKKSRQEKLLREINNIIAKKDGEFKELDLKVKAVSQSLQRLHSDLAVHTQREKGMVEAMRDSEDLLAKRRSEIQRIKDQIDQSRKDLEKLDQQIGRRQTELQLLQETQERKEQELTNVLQDAESEIASRRREIKDCRDEIEQLDHHKADLTAHIKTKRTELQKLKEEREQEEEVLQRLTNNVNKNKSELKHTLEMQKIEITELENVKDQHAQKMAELERTQRALQEEKSDLEQLNSESARKNADLERLRQALERDRLEVDQLNVEKQNLDDRIANLTRDRNLLDENCKTMDDKLNNMKRNQRIMEEKIDSTNGRFEILEAELRVKERETEEAEIQREDMQKEITTLKQSIKESKSELKTLQESLREAENRLREIDQDARAVFHQRDDARQELGRLNEQIRQSLVSIHEHTHQEKVKHKELQDLLRSLAERDKEQVEAKRTLNKLKDEVEKEENRLKRLVGSANSDLEMVRTELGKKQDELEGMRMEYTELQKKSDQLQNNEDKVAELRQICKDLEQALQDREREKAQLAKALSASYEEVQRLCQQSSKKDRLAQEPANLESSVIDNHATDTEQSRQEVKTTENPPITKQSELGPSGDKNSKQKNGTNGMQAELSRARKEDSVTKKQSDKLSDDKENKAVTSIRTVPAHRRSTIHCGHSVKEYNWRKDALRERLAEERDYLRFHLQQQMLRQSETMKSARIKSAETIDCLRWKLNNLQEVLFHASPDVEAMKVLAKARSRSVSPGYKIGLRHARTRSPSPLNSSNQSNYLAHQRSWSYESLGALDSPDRDYL